MTVIKDGKTTELYKLQKETTHNEACRNHHLHYFRQQYPYKTRQTDYYTEENIRNKRTDKQKKQTRITHT